MVCFSFQGENGGMYGQQHIDHYTQRAKGGTGLIIVQSTPVAGAAVQSGVWSSAGLAPLQKIAQNCHAYGAVILLQLSCGNVNINELSLEQIHTLQADCVAATISAHRAGFDGVEYHFAHGYTLCKFFDPSANQRTDQYGGDLTNRLRILTEIIPRIREQVDEKFILAVRMGGNIPDVEGAIKVAQALEKQIDLLHISFGMDQPTNEIPADFICSTIAYNGSQIKKHVSISVITVGGISTAEQAKFLIEKGYSDFVAVGRGMLADANWANGALTGESINPCNNCAKCLWFVNHSKCPARKRVLL